MTFLEQVAAWYVGVVVFPQAPFRATNVPRPTLVSSNCATAPWLSEECRRWLCYSICIGEVVWLFMFCWTYRFILRACPYKFWKVCLGLSIFHRSIMEEIDLLGFCWRNIGMVPSRDCSSLVTFCHFQWSVKQRHSLCKIPLERKRRALLAPRWGSF